MTENMLDSVYSGNPDTTGSSKYAHPPSHKGAAMIRTLLPAVMIAGLYAGLLPDTVFGSDNSGIENTDVLDELSLSNLLTMEITTGSFLDLDLQKSPLSMTIISDEMIRASGARHMSELLEIYVPGFIYNINKWNGTIWAMRGVANDRNTKIIYLINGHKMNTQARDGFQSETILGLLGDIERVEVLRGPAGIVYGSGAIAGIINVVTRKAEGNSSNVMISGGTDGSRSIEGNLYAQPDDNQQIAISAGFKESEGFANDQVRIYGADGWPFSPGTPQGGPGDGRYGSTDGNFKMTGNWTIGNFDLYCRATRQKENGASFFSRDLWPDGLIHPDSLSREVDGTLIEKGDPYWSAIKNSRASRRQYQNDNFFTEASYNQAINENSLKLNVSYDMNTTRLGEEHLPKWDSDLRYLNGRVIETFGEKRLNLSGTYLLKSVSALQAAFGASYHLDMIGPDMEGKNQQYWNEKQYVVRNINYNTFSLFGEGFYDINEILGVHAGVRLDLHTRATMLNPKLAFIVQPNSQHAIKLIYQSASNNGSADNYEYNRYHIDEDGNVKDEPTNPNLIDPPGEHRGLVQPAPGDESVLHELKPEKVHSIELLYVGHLLENVTAEPSVAWGMVKNLFGWNQDLFRVVNVGEYQYINADIDLKYSSPNITIGMNHTFQRPVFTDPNQQSSTFLMYEWTDSAGTWAYPTGVDENGDTTWMGYYQRSKTGELNLVKNSITFDGKNFMSIPTHLSKFYMIVSPFEWMTLSTSLRLVWGLPGMLPVIKSDNDKAHYYGFYHEKKNQSLKDYFMESVAKKWNAGFQIHLPMQFDVGFQVFNILGTDEHKFGGEEMKLLEVDRNTVNTFRISEAFDIYQRGLYSTDQRSFNVTITKYF